MNPLGSPLRRLLIVCMIASLYSFALNAEIVHEAGLAYSALYVLVPLYFVLWVKADSRATGYWPFYHYGLWLFALVPVLVPHYILRTRGLAGTPQAFGFALLSLAPLLSAWLGWVAHPYVPEILWLPDQDAP